MRRVKRASRFGSGRNSRRTGHVSVIWSTGISMEIANGADGHNGSAVQWVEGREWSADGAERAQNRQCVVSQIWRWRDGTKWRRDYLNEGRDGNERRRPPAEAIFDRTLSAWKRTRVHAYGADDAARLQRLPPQLLRGSTDDYITRCYCNLSRQRLAGHRWESLACDSAARDQSSRSRPG